jgi:hypothetical protein
MKNQLESLSQKVILNEKHFSNEKLDTIKNNIVESAKRTAQLYKENELITENIREIKSSTSPLPPDLKKIKLDIKNSLDKIDIESNQHVSDIRHRLKLSNKNKAAKEDDIEEIDQGYTINSFTCPYLQTKFNIPMKNQLCKHHIDKAALDTMLKNAHTCNCPVAGCGKKWTRTSGSRDEDFAYAMERFMKSSQAAGSTLNEDLRNTVDLDDSIDEYTAL